MHEMPRFSLQQTKYINCHKVISLTEIQEVRNDRSDKIEPNVVTQVANLKENHLLLY